MNRLYAVTVVLVMCSFGTALAQTMTNYTASTSGLPHDEIRAICIDGIDEVWFGTKSGLAHFDGATWTTYTTADSLADNIVNSIAFEVTTHGPEIWVATDNGVSIVGITPDAVTFATPYRSDNTGLVADKVNAVAVDENHMKWFGTDEGVSKFDGSDWETFTVADKYYMVSDRILSIEPVFDELSYFGSDSGVARFDGITQATAYVSDDYDIASDTVYSIYITDRENEWFGTDAGLSHHQSLWVDIEWTTYTTADGLADNTVRALTADIDSVMWIGTDNGLSRFDGETWTTYTTADGLAGNRIRALAFDSTGVLWIGTDTGATRFNPVATAVEVDHDTPGALTIEGVFPNPFNLNTSLSFTTTEAGVVRLDVYNLAGQRVRRLLSSAVSPGRHRIVWNGCDDSGSTVSSGIYFVYAGMGIHSDSAKITVIK